MGWQWRRNNQVFLLHQPTKELDNDELGQQLH